MGSPPINDQSLRLSLEDLPAGERIEVFRRFTERPRNLLLYRQLRAWAIPVEGEFGSGGRVTVDVEGEELVLRSLTVENTA